MQEVSFDISFGLDPLIWFCLCLFLIFLYIYLSDWHTGNAHVYLQNEIGISRIEKEDSFEIETERYNQRASFLKCHLCVKCQSLFYITEYGSQNTTDRQDNF